MAQNLGSRMLGMCAVGGKLKVWLDGIRTTVDGCRTATMEIIDDHDADNAAIATDVKTLLNDIRSRLQGDYVVCPTALAIGTTKPNVANGAFDYYIGGKRYSKAAVAAGTALSGDAVPQAKYGAWRLEIGSDGTIDIVAATANGTGYDDAAAAVAGLPALSANHGDMGNTTASKSDGAFTPGTTDLDAANTTVAYTDGTTMFNAIGAAVSTNPAPALTAGDPTAPPAVLSSYE